MGDNLFSDDYVVLAEDKPAYTIYDYMHKDTLKTIREQGKMKKKSKAQFEKVKIFNPKHKLDYYRKVIRAFFKSEKLLEGNNDTFNVEYLVKNKGWITTNNFTRDLNQLCARPTTDRGLMSGLSENSIEDNDEIYALRIHRFKR